MNEDLLKAVKALHAGEVVAHPTETCYGLAADIFNKAAVQHLYRLKGMPLDKPVSILVCDLEEAERYGVFSAKALELAKQHWPGPLTLVVPRRGTLPLWVNFGHDTVGFRVSSNKKARQLVEAFGGPLTTTSANRSGLPEAYSAEEMMDQGLVPECVLNAGRIGKNPPSTIVEVREEQVRVLREGSIKVNL